MRAGGEHKVMNKAYYAMNFELVTGKQDRVCQYKGEVGLLALFQRFLGRQLLARLVDCVNVSSVLNKQAVIIGLLETRSH